MCDSWMSGEVGDVHELRATGDVGDIDEIGEAVGLPRDRVSLAREAFCRTMMVRCSADMDG